MMMYDTTQRYPQARIGAHTLGTATPAMAGTLPTGTARLRSNLKVAVPPAQPLKISQAPTAAQKIGTPSLSSSLGTPTLAGSALGTPTLSTALGTQSLSHPVNTLSAARAQQLHIPSAVVKQKPLSNRPQHSLLGVPSSRGDDSKFLRPMPSPRKDKLKSGLSSNTLRPPPMSGSAVSKDGFIPLTPPSLQTMKNTAAK
eukprot:791412-Amorphochlora_amoeboformis.AAC.1